MPFLTLPAAAAWRHLEAREGFEAAFFRPLPAGGWEAEGTTAAAEDGRAWVVSYAIQLDAAWRTRRARVATRTAAGTRETALEADGAGGWLIDGRPAPHLDGCLDVDLESSAMTNTLPVHRLSLAQGARAESPAAYVRALDLTVERLEQSYRRIADDGGGQRYDYAAPAFGFTACLAYDQSGLVVDYPGIARRHD
jgi:hypothetical protein